MLKNLILAILFLSISTPDILFAADRPAINLKARNSLSLSQESNNRFQRFIINLKEPVSVEQLINLKSASIRSMRKNQIKTIQEQFISKLDQQHISFFKNFSYTSAVAVQATPEGIRILERMEDIISIEKDKRLSLHTAQGIPAINAHNIQSAYSGQGISIAILDTGIDYTHPAMGNGGFPNNKVIGGYDFGDNDSDPMDSNGHGTSCAGIAAGDSVVSGNYQGGVAKDAKLFALKINEGSGGTTYTSTMIDAIEWCIDHMNDDPDNPLKVISMSLGGGDYSSECDSSYYSFTNTVSNAISAGITIVASSGNEGYCGRIAVPACLSDVISVGAVFDANLGGLGFCVSSDSCAFDQETHANCDPDPIAWAYTTGVNIVAPYTNTSDFLDLLAPSHYATTPTTGGGHNTTFGGTSAACPYVAGVAAVMQDAVQTAHGYYLNPGEIRTKLVSSGLSILYEGENDYSITKPRIDLGKTDMDSDGLPSEWEIEYFNNIEKDADDDSDEDGLTEIQEYENQTIPTDEDTDDDDMPDGWEIDNSLDPLTVDSDEDPDSDDYTNLQEYLAGTDPNDPESHPVPLPASNTVLFGIGFLALSIIGVYCFLKKKIQ